LRVKDYLPKVIFVDMVGDSLSHHAWQHNTFFGIRLDTVSDSLEFIVFNDISFHKLILVPVGHDVKWDNPTNYHEK